MKKRVVTIRLSDNLVSLIDLYVSLTHRYFYCNQSGYIKNRTDFIERAIINFDLAVFDRLYQMGYVKAEDFKILHQLSNSDSSLSSAKRVECGKYSS